MQKNDIDRIFSKELSGKHTIPPASVWQQIDTSLQRQRKRKKKQQTAWRAVGIAAGLLLAIGVAFQLFSSRETAQMQTPPRLASESRPTPSKAPLMDRFSEPATPSTPSTLAPADNRLARIAETAPIKQRAPTTPSAENRSETAAAIDLFPKAQPALSFQNKLSEISQRPQRIHASLSTPTSILRDIKSKEEHTATRNEDDDNLIVSVLNVLARSIVPQGKKVQFSNDEEGTISIGISENLVRQKL